jgi:hypothetical protein
MKRQFIAALALIVAFALPAALRAQAGISIGTNGIRIFDSNKGQRHYHVYDDNEDRAYRLYLTQHRRPFVTFQEQNERQQRAYWQYRHKSGGAFENEHFER